MRARNWIQVAISEESITLPDQTFYSFHHDVRKTFEVP
jgi:hypothetical protein